MWQLCEMKEGPWWGFAGNLHAAAAAAPLAAPQSRRPGGGGVIHELALSGVETGVNHLVLLKHVGGPRGCV